MTRSNRQRIHRDKARCGVGSNRLQEIGESRSAKAPDYVPAFNANMPRILLLGKRLNLCQCVFAGLLHRSANRQCPLIQINFRIVDIIAIDWKLFERREFGVVKRRGQMIFPGQLCGKPVAGSDAFFSRDSCHDGTANAPNARTGVSLSSSLRFNRLNLRSSVLPSAPDSAAQ